VGIAIRPLEPSVRRISGKRCESRGYQLRHALSGVHAGVNTPYAFGVASASAVRRRACRISTAMITSATFSCTCWKPSMPIASVSSETSPSMYSVFAVVRVTT
jgi:hypothetical protein